MTPDEPPRESETAGNREPVESQPLPEARNWSDAKAEIVLRKHHICPYLGLRDDRTVVAMLPTPAHACFARRKRYAPSLEHQIVRCLSPAYPGCSIYPDKKPEKNAAGNLYSLQDEVGGNGRGWGQWLRWIGLALLLVVIGALVYGGVVR